jgi:hypothetical protein
MPTQKKFLSATEHANAAALHSMIFAVKPRTFSVRVSRHYNAFFSLESYLYFFTAMGGKKLK